MSDYKTLITAMGLDKIKKALALQEHINLAAVAIGDGKGQPVTPDETMTALVNEVYRGAINSLSLDPANPAYVKIELVIPVTVGGFTVREAGVYDIDGDLFAVTNLPDSYKPLLAQGVGTDIQLIIIIDVQNADVVTLMIDPSIVMASQKWVKETLALTFFGLDVDARGHLIIAKGEDGDSINPADYTQSALLPAGTTFQVSDDFQLHIKLP